MYVSLPVEQREPVDTCWPVARGASFVGPFQVPTPGELRSCTPELSGRAGLSLLWPADNYLVGSQELEAWRDLAGNSRNIQTSVIIINTVLVPFKTIKRAGEWP